MLTANNLSKAYGPNIILQNVSFSVSEGERVGLIGPNGGGKTTLLRLLAGEEKPDSGQVVRHPADLRLGYLAQGFEPDPTLTLAQILHQAVGDPAMLEAELAQLAAALAQEPARADLQAAYDATLHQLNRCDVGRIQTTLSSLGLADVEQDQRVGQLSGGQKTRLALALVLLQDPQLLLLDEPTNHLDIQMLEWLEAWLLAFSGGVLIVSHDRTFLDRTVTRILDLDPETHAVREYAGNYSHYLEQYLQEREKQMSAYKDQVVEIRRLRQDIARTKEQARRVERSTKLDTARRYAKKVAKKAKGRQKKLERYLDSEERVQKPKRSWQMKLELEDAPHLGRDVLTLANLAVGYPGQAPLLRNLNQRVRVGRRIVLTGANGSGKTTLLRTIAGQLRPLAGQARLGASVRLGYMSQEQELLDADLSPLQTIRQVAPINQTEARAFLHFFLFSGDDALRPNRQLSYGERSRLSLALLVAQGCNFLLLDEPINHLDIPSRSRFEEALSHFEGTILAVVHDRYFIDRFATDLWLVENHDLRTKLLRR